MPPMEAKSILALDEYKNGMQAYSEKKLDQAEANLKDALRILKNSSQEITLGYNFILKKLAYISFENSKIAESEKYFKVSADLIKIASKNPLNQFLNEKNLVILYSYTDIEKAANQISKIQGKNLTSG